jgi:hypothetical protein
MRFPQLGHEAQALAIAIDRYVRIAFGLSFIGGLLGKEAEPNAEWHVRSFRLRSNFIGFDIDLLAQSAKPCLPQVALVDNVGSHEDFVAIGKARCSEFGDVGGLAD